jgi:hypothetical protein
MSLRFASDTDVSPENSRAELERMLRKVGCVRFAWRMEPDGAALAFELGDRRFRLDVPMPQRSDRLVTHTPTGELRRTDRINGALAQLERTRWRTLVLAVKAKLAAVEVGLSTLEEAFLADVLLPSGRTVAEETREPIALAYQGVAVPLLTTRGTGS